jgi:hypothetical protein
MQDNLFKILFIIVLFNTGLYSQKVWSVDQVNDADANPVNELQTIDISNDTLYIDRANYVLLTSYLDNTNVDTTFLDGRITILESDIVNKLVWADTLSGANRLATGWDIAQLTLGVTSDWTGVTNKPAGFADDIDNVDDADADPTNELFDSTFIDGRISTLEGAGYLTSESQDISLSVNDLSITGGSTIDLSGYLDNTDVQDLTLVGNTLAISNDPNTNVDLSPYLDNTDTQLNEAQVDAFVNNNGYLEWSDTIAIRASDGYTQSIAYNNGTNNFDVIMASPASSFSFNGSALVDDDELVSVLAARTTDDLTEGATNKYYPSGDKTKVDFITVTQAVDLDDIETKANSAIQTEVQDLTLVGNTLAISGDPNTDVDLSGYLDNVTIDTTYLDNRIHLLESTNDVDSIIGNELQNIDFNPVTKFLLITGGSGDFITDFADSTLVASHATKLATIESGATADQTGAEIKSLYEAESNTNAFTDANVTTLGFITATEAVNLDLHTDTLGVHTDSITNLHLRMIDVENSTVNDLDIDPANEIQGLTLIGDQLDISIDSDPPIDLSGYDNSGINLSSVISNGSSAASKITNLTLGTNPLDAANLNNVTNAVAASDALDLDRDTTNEFQNISLVGTSILLNDIYGGTGSTVDLDDFTEGLANSGSGVTVSGTGSAIVGTPTSHYSKVKQPNGDFLYVVYGEVVVSITSNPSNDFTVNIPSVYTVSFESADDARGTVTVWGANKVDAYYELDADTSNSDIDIMFTGTGVNQNYTINFTIAYNQ